MSDKKNIKTKKFEKLAENLKKNIARRKMLEKNVKLEETDKCQ